MKNIRYAYRAVGLLSIVLAIGLTMSCKKGTSQLEYRKAISEKAKQDNAKCPIDYPNGTRLESVFFEDSILTYRIGLSDEAIVTVNVTDSATRKDIIGKLSDNMKEYLTKGNCRLIYKYVSPHDSSYIEILPSELENSLK